MVLLFAVMVPVTVDALLSEFLPSKTAFVSCPVVAVPEPVTGTWLTVPVRLKFADEELTR